jgi:hypothetical protein
MMNESAGRGGALGCLDPRFCICRKVPAMPAVGSSVISDCRDSQKTTAHPRSRSVLDNGVLNAATGSHDTCQGKLRPETAMNSGFRQSMNKLPTPEHLRAHPGLLWEGPADRRRSSPGRFLGHFATVLAALTVSGQAQTPLPDSGFNAWVGGHSIAVSRVCLHFKDSSFAVRHLPGSAFGT